MGLLKKGVTDQKNAAQSTEISRFSFRASTIFIVNCMMGNWDHASHLPNKSLKGQTKAKFFFFPSSE